MAKAAFIVGINAYDPPNTLPSCVNDADNFARLLSATYGFQSIANLRDREASKSAILDGLNTLLKGAVSGDNLVFYFSGHGYSFQQGTAWIEALVPQDADFLTSDDLSAVTQGVPPNSLTIVLDSCFSGGMQKAFAKLGGVKPVRVKYWTPPTSTEKAFDPALPAILTLKAFGGSPSSIDITSLVPDISISSKDFSTVSPPSSDRHFILLSACKADETAAASTDRTDGQSAFTFSLLQQISSNGSQIGVAGLLDETGSELRQLGVRQTPMLKVPSAPPDLSERAFLLWDQQPIPQNQAKSVSGLVTSQAPSSSTVKGFVMPQFNKDWLSDVESIVRTVTPVIAGALKDYQPPSKGFEPPSQSSIDKGWFDDLTRTIATVIPAIVQGMKDFEPPSKGFSDAPPQPFDKGWFDTVTSIIATTLPVITASLKGYQGPSGSLSDLSKAAQKGWFDDVTHVIASVLPVVISATKDLKPAGLAPSKGFQVPNADDKGFWDTVASIAQVAVPIALAVV